MTLLVLGDTQYLFDGERTRPDLLAATFTEVAALQATGAITTVRHVIHVGDVGEHGWPGECELAARTLAEGLATIGGPALTVATGNHDVGSETDESRGPTPFLAAFGPGSPLLDGAHAVGLAHGPGGYSSWREVDLGGRTVGVLALDWRPLEAGWAWAAQRLAAAPDLPTILVTHDVAEAGELTENGERLAALARAHPQVFLVLGGHHWPATRVRRDGREFHAVNHQQLPFGGAGAARLYSFDEDGLARATTICPGRSAPDVLRNVAAQRGLALGSEEDQFAFPLPPALRPPGLPVDRPAQVDPDLTPVADLTPSGVLEVEVALGARYALEVEATLPAAFPESWQVLACRLADGSTPDGDPPAALSLSTENFAGWNAVVDPGQTWANSHELTPGARVRLVVTNGARAGLWVDDDLVGRSDPGRGRPLAAGGWRWRIGAGEFAGRECEAFGGTVHRVRFWSGD